MIITEARVRLWQNAREMRDAVKGFDRALVTEDFPAIYDAANLLARLSKEAADICMPAVTEDGNDIPVDV